MGSPDTRISHVSDTIQSNPLNIQQQLKLLFARLRNATRVLPKETTLQIPKIGPLLEDILKKIDPRAVMHPFEGSFEEEVKAYGFSIPRLILRTNRRLAAEYPEVTPWVLQLGDTNFIVYQEEEQFPLNAQHEVKIPKPLERTLNHIAELTLDERGGKCDQRSRELVTLHFADTMLAITPQVPDNIIGNTGGHYITGSQLEDGRYILVDPTWPLHEYNTFKAKGLPYGIVIFASNESKAQKIAKVVYGGIPQVA